MNGPRYLSPGDPGSFTDYPPQSPDENRPLECPVCAGRGGWNLRVDAYGPGKHFRAHCSQCNGWGHTREVQTCLHEWAGRKTVGRCLNVYTCSKCGAQKEVDSSD